MKTFKDQVIEAVVKELECKPEDVCCGGIKEENGLSLSITCCVMDTQIYLKLLEIVKGGELDG